MDKRVKYALYGTAGVATLAGTYYGAKALMSTNSPGATLLTPVQAVVTLASGGALARWTRSNGQPPTSLLEKGSPTFWPDGTGASSATATRDVRGLHTLIQRVTTANDKLAACYVALAVHEAGVTASHCYRHNAWGVHWYRTMEPRPGFLSTDAGVPTMFLAFENWTQSVQYLHDTLLERSDAYASAKADGAAGDIVGFTRYLGQGGYAAIYRRNPEELRAVYDSLVNRGALARVL